MDSRLAALSGSTLAQNETELPTDDETPTEPGPDEFEDAVAILNYALTLEHLGAGVYRQGLEPTSEADLCNCEPLVEESALRDRVHGDVEPSEPGPPTDSETTRGTAPASSVAGGQSRRAGLTVPISGAPLSIPACADSAGRMSEVRGRAPGQARWQPNGGEGLEVR